MVIHPQKSENLPQNRTNLGNDKSLTAFCTSSQSHPIFPKLRKVARELRRCLDLMPIHRPYNCIALLCIEGSFNNQHLWMKRLVCRSVCLNKSKTPGDCVVMQKWNEERMWQCRDAEREEQFG